MIAQTYRMVEHESGLLHIHRVTTNAKGEILGIAATPVDAAGMDVAELKRMYEAIMAAFDHPVIAWSFLPEGDGKGV